MLVGEQTAHVVRLAAGLIGRGLRVACLDGPRLQQVLLAEHHLSIDNYASPEIRLKGRYRFAWVRGIETAIRRCFLRRLIRRIRPSLIHINFIDPRHLMLCELGAVCPPIVATVWGSDVHTYAIDGSPDQRSAIIEILRRAGAITADSPFMLDLVKKLVPDQPASQMRLAYFGIDADAFERCSGMVEVDWRARLGLEAGLPVVLAPRRIGPRYFPERILRAFAQSEVARRGYLVFKLFGDKPYEEPAQQAQLEQSAKQLGIYDRVRFAPPCPYSELPSLYRLADAACFLLDRDGTPSTAFELWAAGVPIIASDIEYYRGILVDQENAFLVPPEDASVVARAMDRVLTDRAAVQTVVENGRRWVREHANFDTMIETFLTVYQQAGLWFPRANSC